MPLRLVLILCCCLATFASSAAAQLRTSHDPAPGAVCVARAEAVADIYIDPADVQPAGIAAALLADDIHKVTGKTPRIVGSIDQLGTDAVLVGTIGHSALIDQLIAAHKIDVDDIRGQWESYKLAVIADPAPNVKQALVIVGSDRRGTAYGVFTLSASIGVSPWYWWADVPVVPQPTLYVLPTTFTDGPPGVKYRGIFLNDEAPAMSGWSKEKFGGFNHAMYQHVFELLLRLKANYLWPAMWGSAFNEDDPENPRLANDYGIVMGTSHQEPMLRAQGEFDHRYPPSDWNYATHPQLMEQFWREGIRRNRDYESLITIGMRGRNDTPMIANATIQQSMDLLEKIVAAQRKILTEEMGRPADTIPQMWCLYKEVQSYYEHGLRVPDDVTLLWSDDNWGNIRRLPTEAERTRSGGAGIYYHFDYVGDPRNYKWINTNPIAKVWEQMNLAYHYDANRIWIVNVGDLKPMELPIDFFLTMAWNPAAMTEQRMSAFTQSWSAQQFGPEHAGEIASLIDWYTRMNGRRKPELLTEPTYSLLNYGEADQMLADCRAETARAEALAKLLPADEQDAYFELVLHPVKATAIVNQLYILAAKNRLYAAQGRASTSTVADAVRADFQADADLSDQYNHALAGGKWDHMMDQTHIGYTTWQEPPRNILPALTDLQVFESPAMAVAVEGSANAWPAMRGTRGESMGSEPTGATPMLPAFDSLSRQRHYIDVFNRGGKSFNYTATADHPWIRVDAPTGTVDADRRLWVDVDWDQLAAASTPATGSIEIAGPGTAPITVRLTAVHHAEPTRQDLVGFAESNGCVSIEAEHYSNKVDSPTARWEKIDGDSRTLSAMSIFPVTAASILPGAGISTAPCLEYQMYVFDPGRANVTAYISPTQNFVPGRGPRYAISFDSEPPQVIDSLGSNTHNDWQESVKDNIRKVGSSHTLAGAGYHTLKFWMVDPGIVLQKLVVDFGGVKASYLGPPESFHARTN